jgi:carbamoyltransferase
VTAILGINAYHGDSSACLIVDGHLVAAAEEERFSRIKHWAGFPVQAISSCLHQAGLKLSDVSDVAMNTDPRANLAQKFAYSIVHRPSVGFLRERLANRKKKVSIQDQMQQLDSLGTFSGRVHHIEHHRAHLGSAFLVSPFDRAVVVSIDGFGDFASAAWGLGEADRLSVDGKILFPHSLGIFYMSMTQYLGFPNWGDEYKVMGLAPYGKPVFMDALRQIASSNSRGEYRLNLQYFRHQREQVQHWRDFTPVVSPLFTSGVESLLGIPPRAGGEISECHLDLARSTQQRYEELFFTLLNRIHSRYGVDALALAGGCAMNSVANGKIYQNTPFKRLYVQSAAGDAGGALGAALEVARQHGEIDRQFVMDHASWGPSFSEPEVAAIIKSSSADLQEKRCKASYVEDDSELFETVARSISEGDVVGWFQGKMEWGPRALGNRSIVCDPRRGDMKDILNKKIKRRESFRPFAPSILREHVSQWFETDDDVPFMTQVYSIRPAKRSLIPAVTHVDGSGRLQTVSATAYPRYYRLIQAFAELTGVPMVLNTSFNENEPVVCKPSEALDCFLRTNMDVLVMGNWLVRRS